MFRRATALFVTVLMMWHGLAMSLLGADVADVPPMVQQMQVDHAAQSGMTAGALADHYVDDQPGQLSQLQATDTLLGAWHLSCAGSLHHLRPVAPKDVIHQSPWPEGLNRPPNTLPTSLA